MDESWNTFRGWLTFERLMAERNFDEKMVAKIRCTEEMMNAFQRSSLQKTATTPEEKRC